MIHRVKLFQVRHFSVKSSNWLLLVVLLLDREIKTNVS